MGFLGGAVRKNPPANAGDATDMGSISGSGRCPGVGNGNPLQYSCLENSMDCIIHGVAKNWTQLSNFYFQPPRALEIEPDNIKSERTDT